MFTVSSPEGGEFIIFLSKLSWGCNLLSGKEPASCLSSFFPAARPGLAPTAPSVEVGVEDVTGQHRPPGTCRWAVLPNRVCARRALTWVTRGPEDWTHYGWLLPALLRSPTAFPRVWEMYRTKCHFPPWTSADSAKKLLLKQRKYTQDWLPLPWRGPGRDRLLRWRPSCCQFPQGLHWGTFSGECIVLPDVDL